MYQDRLKLYDRIVGKCSRFDRKGKTMPYTSANGYMFSLLNKDGQLGFRYAKSVQEAYFEKFKTGHFKSYGATMKGYIAIPDELLKNEDLLIDLLNESFDYVMTLEPK